MITLLEANRFKSPSVTNLQHRKLRVDNLKL